MIQVQKKAFNETIAYKLHELVLMMDKMAHAYLKKEFDISYNQFLVMTFLLKETEVNQDFLAIHLNFTKSAVSQIVDQLCKKSLLRRKINRNNRRENLLTLTEKGYSIISKAHEMLENKSVFCIENNSSQEELEHLENFLDRNIRVMYTELSEKNPNEGFDRNF